MMRASVLLCIVLGVVACSAQGWAPQQYIPSFQFEGFDILWANDTSFLDEVTYDWNTNTMYVAGEGWIQEVDENPFQISYMGAFRWNHQFVDFKVFSDTKGNTFAVGPIPNLGGWGADPTIGMNYPFSIVGSNTQHPISEAPPGNYIMAAVQLNASVADVNVAYFVGWHQHWNATAGTNFTIIRSTVNTLNIPSYTNPQNTPIFKYNHDGNDRVYLHSEGFIAYDREFKPIVFHSPTHQHLAIVDPATNAVYRVSTPLDITQPIAYNAATDLLRISRWRQIVGATYDHVNHWVYIGVQGWGTMPGAIVVVDMFTMQMIVNYTLQNYESNPRSMSLDGMGNLYVGLYGSMAMLKINVANSAAWTTQSYATIPFYLKNVYNIKVVNNYVYMVTNEQHSVVARIPTANFCPHVCDFLLGYCSNAECACFNTTLYEVGKDKRTCVEKALSSEKGAHDQAKRNEGGEVALGLLFTVAFIAAVIGWFMVYRLKSNPYKHLQEHERLLH